jgi:hypothetical protein
MGMLAALEVCERCKARGGEGQRDKPPPLGHGQVTIRGVVSDVGDVAGIGQDDPGDDGLRRHLSKLVNGSSELIGDGFPGGFIAGGHRGADETGGQRLAAGPKFKAFPGQGGPKVFVKISCERWGRQIVCGRGWRGGRRKSGRWGLAHVGFVVVHLMCVSGEAEED